MEKTKKNKIDYRREFDRLLFVAKMAVDSDFTSEDAKILLNAAVRDCVDEGLYVLEIHEPTKKGCLKKRYIIKD